jgi:hypothetical protein
MSEQSELQIARQRVAQLEEALRPFADMGEQFRGYARPELAHVRVPGNLLFAAMQALDAE